MSARQAVVSLPPVVAIDGPSASGKGTVAQRVAKALGFHYLDSGALYRVVALAAERGGVDLQSGAAVAAVAGAMPLRFEGSSVWLGEEDVTQALRTESISSLASKVAALPEVRAALLAVQRGFRRAPGLVADGRDMGSLVFPDAALKIFLTAAAAVRAERRHKQLMEKGIHASMPDLLRDIEERDARDQRRAVAPLQRSVDAQLLDTTALTIDAAVAEVLRLYAARGRA